MVAQVVWEPNARLVSVQDTQGNTYSPATPVARTAAGLQQQIWYAPNIKAGPNIVKATFANARRRNDLYIHEFTGLDPESPLKTSATNSGTGPIARLAEIESDGPASLIFVGVRADLTRELIFPADFVVRPLDGFVYSAEKVTTVDGLHRVEATLSTPTSWLIQAAVFTGPRE